MQYYSDKGITFITAVLVIGYLIGTMTHSIHFSEVIKLGFINSAKAFGVSPVVNGYWISLTLIDPIIAFLLIKKRKIGAVAAFITILVNVIVNSSVQIASLLRITFHSVYDSLGNIFNGLQIALLLFSIITLPLFFTKNNVALSQKLNYVHIFNFIPFMALTAGLLIHLVGLIHLTHKFESLWVLWVHVSMTICDGGLIYALWKKMKLGYIVGIISFSIFGLLQAGFAIAIFIGVNCTFNLTMAITIAVCCLSIAALLMSGDVYSSSVKQLAKQPRS